MFYFKPLAKSQQIFIKYNNLFIVNSIGRYSYLVFKQYKNNFLLLYQISIQLLTKIKIVKSIYIDIYYNPDEVMTDNIRYKTKI